MNRMSVAICSILAAKVKRKRTQLMCFDKKKKKIRLRDKALYSPTERFPTGMPKIKIYLMTYRVGIQLYLVLGPQLLISLDCYVSSSCIICMTHLKKTIVFRAPPYYAISLVL